MRRAPDINIYRMRMLHIYERDGKHRSAVLRSPFNGICSYRTLLPPTLCEWTFKYPECNVKCGFNVYAENVHI